MNRMSCFYFILTGSFCLTNSEHMRCARAIRIRLRTRTRTRTRVSRREERRQRTHPGGLLLWSCMPPGGTRERAYSLQERTRGYDVCQRVTRYQSEPYRRQERQRIGECAWNRGVCIIVIIKGKGQTVMIICRICICNTCAATYMYVMDGDYALPCPINLYVCS